MQAGEAGSPPQNRAPRGESAVDSGQRSRGFGPPRRTFTFPTDRPARPERFSQIDPPGRNPSVGVRANPHSLHALPTLPAPARRARTHGEHTRRACAQGGSYARRPVRATVPIWPIRPRGPKRRNYPGGSSAAARTLLVARERIAAAPRGQPGPAGPHAPPLAG